MSLAVSTPHELTAREMEALKNPELNSREVQVLQMAADGYSCAATAEALQLGMSYIKNCRHRAEIKLGADNLHHAVAVAMRKGLIQ